MADVSIEVLENGPYIIEGAVDIINYDGQPMTPPAGRKTIALCRCGASVNKPFCDGQHSKIGFKGAQAAVLEAEG
ncbi:MAG TPA: CDGSH iron-sulfur domain-containing protein [Capsulimonadaceae bacterium]|jgi:3-phenylpropionate/trans-cinnamate dioxygenase ferredoxin subunit